MRLRSYVIAAISTAMTAAFIIGISKREQLEPVSGPKIRLISASKPLDVGPDTSTFSKGFLIGDELHVVVRSWFYQSGEIEVSYDSVGKQQSAVLNIDVQHGLAIFGTKCEFIRQVEVAIPASHWKGLRTIQVFNRDIGKEVDKPISVSDIHTVYAARVPTNDSLKEMANAC